MITYQLDEKKKYLDEILFHLRKHNNQFTGGKTYKPLYVYLIKNKQCHAAAEANCGWDWVSFKKLYYHTIDELRIIVNETQKNYQDITGIKLITKVESRYQDFISAGFIDGEKLHFSNHTWYYANLYQNIQTINHDYTVLVAVEPIKEYQKVLVENDQQFKNIHDLVENPLEVVHVALDDQTFVGGIKLEIYEDHVYTHLLAVNNQYRGLNIGSELMKFAEKEAVERRIKYLEVGTAEFQAKSFYEKLGYKVVYTRKNNPKGYECYTLTKEI